MTAKKITRIPSNETTSRKVASIAGGLLANPKTSAKVKTVAASALTQAANKTKKK